MASMAMGEATEASTAIITITTRSSTRVKPLARRDLWVFMMGFAFTGFD
jgi:hypothetical protein